MDPSSERVALPADPAAVDALQPTRAVEPLDEVMDRCARGDDGALEEVYRLGAPRVRLFLARLCGDMTLADDLTQDAFMRIYRARGSFMAGVSALPWMFAIARNAFRDHLRKERVARRAREESSVEEQHVAPDNSSDRAVMARQRLQAVQQALMKLPVRQREAFTLLRFEGLSLAEGAQVLGTTPAATKILVHRAYVAIRVALDREDQRRGGTPPTSPAAP